MTLSKMVSTLDSEAFKSQKLWLIQSQENPLLSEESKEAITGILALYMKITDAIEEEGDDRFSLPFEK